MGYELDVPDWLLILLALPFHGRSRIAPGDAAYRRLKGIWAASDQ